MSETYTAFSNGLIVARGTRAQVARRLAEDGETSVLIFSDETGREIDLDLSGGAVAVATRYPDAPARGRPKLGVVAREVTLLPRHWDWLATQRGGASAALRRLVEEASRGDEAVLRRDAAYRFCSAIAGDLPGFEEAMRDLYAGRAKDFRARMADWPDDIRTHAVRLAGL
ncbi:DUF2239 family protein [Pseudooceanicola onchidii]|uniref:DUF2239 family protein n=1 Tax=Pseudooceanicola onchidii TaxID=2562279 RepID=UPI0010AACD46|nr:DUF2239 family protein [Pseudooceanicola onchidii]